MLHSLRLQSAHENHDGEKALHKRLFLTWNPLALACVALLGLKFPNPAVLWIEVVVGSIIACVSLASLCTIRARLRISRVLGAGLLQGYALGTFPTAYGDFTNWDRRLIVEGPAVHGYSLALCQIYLGVAVLWLVGELTEPYVRMPALTSGVIQKLKQFTWLGLAVTLLALLMGDIGFMGAQHGTEEAGKLSFFTNTASWMIAPTVGTAATVFAISRRRFQQMLYGTALVVELLATVPTGRRNFLYALLLAFTLFSYWRPSFSRSLWKVTVTLASSVLIVSVMWTAFLYLRLASYSFEEDHVSLRDQAERAWQLYTAGSQASTALAWQESGVEERVDIISYDTLLLDETASHGARYGENAWNEFKWTIPNALWANKKISTEEEYASELFGLAIPDQPNSIFSAATLDFGFWGGLFYPFLISWSLVLLMKGCWRFFPSPGPYLCLCVVLVCCLQTELELFCYFDTLRDTLLFGAIFSLLLPAIPAVLHQPDRYTLRSEY